MAEGKINQKVRLKDIEEKKNYTSKEINKIELMSRRHKKFYAALNYIEQLLILASAGTGGVSVSLLLLQLVFL